MRCLFEGGVYLLIGEVVCEDEIFSKLWKTV